jgi:serine/threonine-protein kinase
MELIGPTGGGSLIGRVVANYEIRSRLGAGAMGEVYLAWDRKLRRDVALKVLPPGTIADIVAQKRLRREARALARLNHHALATLYELIDTEPDLDCLVMEYVSGESLDRVVQRGPLEETMLLQYAVDIADGLAAAHEAGVIHRDIKPANIRIASTGRVKLLDFGLARQIARTTSSTSEYSGADQTEGEIAGTLLYLAPESWSGEPGASCDLYSLGVTLYELATGSPPFKGLPNSALVHAIQNVRPEPARDRRPELSEGLDAVIVRLLSKRPEDRFASARELHRELDRLHLAMRSGAPPPLFGVTLGKRARRPILWAATLLGVVLALTPQVRSFVGRLFSPPPEPRSVVVGVLPFTDHSGDSARAYFADGVTEELTGRLAEHDSIQVISRTTMMRFRASGRSVPEIAAEVGANRIVQGSVRRQGDRVKLSVQIIHGETDKTLWSRQFTGALEDILRLEDRIVAELASRMRGGPVAGSAERPRAAQVDPLAYDLYQRGRHELDRRSEDGIRQSRGYFLASLERDSTFAPAWAGLANAWSAAGFSGFERPLAAFPQARRAAQRALDLDPELADGHVSLANILQNHDWDWAGAERAFARALELNPSHSVAHHWYASHLALRGEFDLAMAEIERARELDPRSLPIAVGTGAILYFARRYEASLDSLRTAAGMDSTSGLVQRTRAASLDRLGREGEAVRAICLWLDSQRLQPVSAAVAQGYQSAGIRGAATVLRLGLERKRDAGLYEPATHVAELHARLNEREAAIRWLLLAERERDTELNRLKVDPIFDPLRGDPRFEALVGRVGLGQGGSARKRAPTPATAAM